MTGDFVIHCLGRHDRGPSASRVACHFLSSTFVMNTSTVYVISHLYPVLCVNTVGIYACGNRDTAVSNERRYLPEFTIFSCTGCGSYRQLLFHAHTRTSGVEI